MAKAKKMAVKNRQNKQRKFEFKAPRATKSLLRVASVALLVTGISFVGWHGIKIWQTVWPVKQVLLQGETIYIQDQDIADFVRSQPQQGMLAIELEEMQNAAAQLDWVDKVEIRKVWPEQLVFYVVEHEPVVRIGGKVLTEKGTLISQGNQTQLFESLPQLVLEKEVGADEYLVKKYQRVWQEFKQVKNQFDALSLNLISLKIDKVNNWQLEFADGLEMNLGRKDRAQRVERLGKVYSAINNKQHLKSIDLRYHNGLAVEWNKQEKIKG